MGTSAATSNYPHIQIVLQVHMYEFYRINGMYEWIWTVGDCSDTVLVNVGDDCACPIINNIINTPTPASYCETASNVTIIGEEASPIDGVYEWSYSFNGLPFTVATGTSDQRDYTSTTLGIGEHRFQRKYTTTSGIICEDLSNIITINVYQNPTATITGDNEICAGESTVFTANGGSTYLWNTLETNASIIVDVALEYFVTVTDVNGCTATASRTLTVTPLPNAGADVSVTCYETGVAVMSASGVGTWTLGTSAGTAIITNPNSATTTITNFSINGTYELIWTVGDCSDNVLINVGDDCACPIINNIINTPTPSSYCETVSNVTIIGEEASPIDGVYEWSYSFNGSAFIVATGTNDQRDYTTTTLGIGEHRFQRKYTTTSGIICEDLSNIVTINVYPNPTAIITGDSEICAGESTIFTVNGGVTYLWDTNEKTSFISVSVAREYIVTVTDVNGCTATASRTLTVNPLPTASITGDNEICVGENTIFTANGGSTYLWNTLETNASITVDVALEYIVTVTDVNGCTATASRTLTVNPLPTASITGDNEICVGEYTIFTANGGSTYLWNTLETNASITVDLALEYFVTVTDLNGCKATASRTLTVTPLPNAGADVSVTCYETGVAVMSASGVGTWTLGTSAGTAIITNPNSATTTITNFSINGTYELIWTVGACSDTVLVNVGDDCDCPIINNIINIPTPSSYCETASNITIIGEEASPIDGVYEWSYSFNGSPFAVATGTNHQRDYTTTTLGIGEHRFQRKYTTTSGIICEDLSNIVTINVNPNPTATITGDNEICAGENSIFTANGGVTYLWDTNETTSFIIVSVAREYIVTVTDVNGCTATASRTLTVNPLPIAIITGNNTICTGESTIFTVNGGVTYLWDTNETTSFISVSVAREFIVTVTDVNGCTATASRTLTVNPLPIASITGDNEICAGENTIFTANGGATYLWNTAETSASITVDAAIEYIVTVTDLNGCTATASRTLTVTPLPNAGADVSVTCYETGVAVMSASGVGTWTLGTSAGTAIITNPNSATTTITNFSINGTYELIWTVGSCSDMVLVNLGDDCDCPIINNIINTPTPSSYCETASNVTIIGEEASPIDGVYEWSYSFNGSAFIVATGTNDQRDYTTTTLGIGEHRFQRKYTTTSGIICEDLSNIVTINVYPNPTAIITGDSEICAGENSIFTVNGGVTYLWDTNETTSFITVSVAKEYIVTVTDVNGCTATASRTLTVNPLPIVSITGDNEICAGENTIFTANGGVTYLWDTNETSSFITVSVAREYIVTVTDVKGCTATASRTLTVNPLPIASITGDNEICAGENTIFTANGGASYLWNTLETSAFITVDVADEYIVTATDVNGCTATASRTLTVTPLPNAGADVSVTCYETGVAVMSASGVGTWTLGTSAGTAIITNPNSATTTITNFSINGTYELIWTVGDCSDAVLLNVGDDCACPIINNIINTPTPNSYCETASNITIIGEEASPIDGVYEWSYSFNGSPFAVANGSNDQRDYTTTTLGIGKHRFQRKYTTTSGIICEDLSNIITINVYQNPAASITGDDKICAGESTIFTANGGATYLWDTNETSSFITVSVAREYVVAVTDVNGCTATASRTLTVTPLPNAGADVSVTCYETGVAVMSASGVGTWTLGTSAGTAVITNPNSATTTITNFSINGTYELIWTVGACSDTVLVTVGDDCDCPIINNIINTPTPSSYCETASNVTIIGEEASPIDGVYEWSYSFNGSPFAVANGTNDQRDYTATTLGIGEHRFQRKYTTTSGIICEDLSNIVTINVNPNPTATITGDNEICAGENTIFTANGGVTYLWSTTETSASITVDAAIEYFVTVTDLNGCTATASRILTVNPLPTASITGDNEICVGENTIFTANGGSTYLWNTLETNASITVDVALEYIVTVTDINGCTATSSRTLTVTPLPNAGSDVSVTCYETGVAVMSASGLGTWTLGTSAGTVIITNPNSATTTITNFSINGIYELIWTVGDCSDAVLLNVGDDCACPIINNIINTPTPPSYCEAASNITIIGEEASPIGGVYEWSYSFNGSPFTVAAGTNDQRDYTATTLGIGEHRFQRKYTSTSGIICDDLSNIVTINVYPNPTAIITGDSEICAGGNSIFTANGGATYLWDTNETTSFITVSAAREYIVTVSDANGCTATASRTLTVTPLPNAGSDISVTCYETGVAVMSASGVGTWTLGTSAGTAIITNPNSATTTITNFSINGTYELIWTVGACSDTVLVTVGDDCALSDN
jgi:hypothetical protein